MQTTSANWVKWSETLSRFGLKNLVGWLLETGEPFTLVGAQMIYFGQPFLNNDKANNLAAFLEDQEETRAFAAFLRKE